MNDTMLDQVVGKISPEFNSPETPQPNKVAVIPILTPEEIKPEEIDIQTPRARAYQLYLEGLVKNTEIAEQVGIKVQTLYNWITAGKWRNTRDQMERDVMLRSNDSFARFIIEQRESIAREQLSQALQIQAMINKRTEKREDGSVPFNNPKDLNMLADALKKVTDITSRIVGIHEKSLSDVREMATESKKEEMWIQKVEPILNKISNSIPTKELSRPSPF